MTSISNHAKTNLTAQQGDKYYKKISYNILEQAKKEINNTLNKALLANEITKQELNVPHRQTTQLILSTLQSTQKVYRTR
jgi:hypothetical protein